MLAAFLSHLTHFQLYLPTHHFLSPVLALLQAVRQHRLFLLRVPVARHPGLCPHLVPSKLPGHHLGGRGQSRLHPARLQTAGGQDVGAGGQETPRLAGLARPPHVLPQQLLLLRRHSGQSSREEQMGVPLQKSNNFLPTLF